MRTGLLAPSQMANEFIGQQKYLTTGCPYKFHPPEYASDENMSFRNILTNALNQNAAAGKLYKKAYTFQQRAVISIQGPRPKAKLLMLPKICLRNESASKKNLPPKK
jgi:hypothetical protein